jgi:hypothetical protein
MQTVMPLFEDSIGVSERSKVLSIVSAFWEKQYSFDPYDLSKPLSEDYYC